MSGERERPETVKLLWCPACGLSDRYKHLSERHRPFHLFEGERLKGGLCPGELQTLIYRLEGSGSPEDPDA